MTLKNCKPMLLWGQPQVLLIAAMWDYGTISSFDLIVVARVLFSFSQNGLQVFCSGQTSSLRASYSSMGSSWAPPSASPDRLPALPTLLTVDPYLLSGFIYLGDRVSILTFLLSLLYYRVTVPPTKVTAPDCFFLLLLFSHKSSVFLACPPFSTYPHWTHLPTDSKGSLLEPSPEDLVYTYLLVRSSNIGLKSEFSQTLSKEIVCKLWHAIRFPWT